jgi:hypothetical protein
MPRIVYKKRSHKQYLNKSKGRRTTRSKRKSSHKQRSRKSFRGTKYLNYRGAPERSELRNKITETFIRKILIETPDVVKSREYPQLPAVVYDNRHRNAENIQKYKDILYDSNSWEPHSLQNSWKPHQNTKTVRAIWTDPNLGFQVLDAYNYARQKVAAEYPNHASEYNPKASSHLIDIKYSKQMSALLLENAQTFFEHIIRQYSTAKGFWKVHSEYCIVWRFDQASHDHSNTWHMDNLDSKRTYASDGAHSFDTSLVMAFCRDQTNKENVECGTQVLLGVPVLTVKKFQELCDVDSEGSMFVRKAPFTQESMRQYHANILQESTLEVLEKYKDEQLQQLGIEIYQDVNFLLHNTVQYLFHRGHRWKPGVERAFISVDVGPPNRSHSQTREVLKTEITVDGIPITLHIHYF